MKISTFLCPVDFSAASDGALRYAVALAARAGASIHLVHTWQLSAYASPTSELALAFRADLERDLEALAQRYSGSGVVIHRHLRLGVPYQEIAAAASELDADMIIMGTTGKTGIEHFLLGSVAERVVRTATVPVLTVKHDPSKKP